MNHKVITKVPIIEFSVRVINVEQDVPCNIPMPSLENIEKFKNRNLYSVLALGKQSRLLKGIIQGKIFIPDCFKQDELEMRFIRVKYWFTNGAFVSDFKGPYDGQWSLKDCNVIPNNYNLHKLFYCRKCAEAYLQTCLDNPSSINSPFDRFSG